jgi:trk system potassium uptake protein TrkH
MRRRNHQYIPLRPLVATVAWPVGALLAGIAVTMLAVAVLGALMGTAAGAGQMGLSAVITTALAGGLLFLGRERERERLGRREALLTVSASWVALSLVGGLPFIIGADFSLADAVFESTSGFTTTGATILPEIRDRLNPALHFWRMLSHWLGGMGVVVLFVAVFPALGVGGKHLFRSEVPGPKSQGLTPRIRQTSLALWRIYLGITVVEFVLLMVVSRFPPFEAAVHSLSTLGTGGFSTMNGSIAGLEIELGLTRFQAVSAEWIILIFMLVAGMNFGLFHEALQRGPRVFLRHTETRVYAVLMGLSTLFVSASLLPIKAGDGPWVHSVHEAIRDAAFQLASVASTTGFGTDDFELWPTFAKMVLLCFYFIGGCTGSTAGGMKVVRWIILAKTASAELKRSFRPHLMSPVRVGRQVITQQHLVEILAFSALFLLTVIIGAAAIALLESLARQPIDGTTAVMASLACVANVGPGLGMVGPTDNFGFFTGASKVVLSVCMILGRLEFLTVLAIFTPAFWRR